MASISTDASIAPTINGASEFFKDLKYTNKLIPNKDDRSSVKVAKWAVIFFTLGLIFIIPLTIDYSTKLFNKIFGRQKPPIPLDLPDDDDNDNSLQQNAAPAPIVPVPTTSQRIRDTLSNVFTKENAKKTLSSAWEGITLLPQKATECFEREGNDTYNKVGLIFGITVPFCIASSLGWGLASSRFIWTVLGGTLCGSAVCFLYTASGYGLIKLHERLLTPPQAAETSQENRTANPTTLHAANT